MPTYYLIHSSGERLARVHTYRIYDKNPDKSIQDFGVDIDVRAFYEIIISMGSSKWEAFAEGIENIQNLRDTFHQRNLDDPDPLIRHELMKICAVHKELSFTTIF